MCSEQEKIEKNSLPQRTDIIYKLLFYEQF